MVQKENMKSRRMNETAKLVTDMITKVLSETVTEDVMGKVTDAVTEVLNDVDFDIHKSKFIGRREGQYIVLYERVGNIELPPKKSDKDTDSAFIENLIKLYAENIM